MSGSFLDEHAVGSSTDPGIAIENPWCVRCTVDGALIARQGSMVSYRGDLAIATKGQGVKKLLKRAVTGEGLALMEVSGTGEIWLADLAKNVFVLPGDGLSVAGKSVLCFEAGLDYEIRRVKGAGMTGGGLFNSEFTGAGNLALTTHGEPMVIPVTPDAPVFVDTDAVIGWSSSLATGITRSQKMRSLLRGGSGEMYQLRLEGEGAVIVQPSEGPVAPDGGGGGVGNAIGDVLGG